MMIPDSQLLQDYAHAKSQDAFTELVQRHLNLVYSAALRQIRSPQLAEEISQSVFADLARAADKLKPDTLLSAWLYQVTRRTAIDVVRRESRRQARERLAVEMAAMNTAANWTHIEPLLDDAMEALDETDRAAILLRYFENKSLRQVGQTLGTSDDAAQKRVSRAVERLREFFSKRGVAVGATSLVVIIPANAVQAAPLILATTISATALLGTIHTSTALTATKAIAMTTMQKLLVTATVAIIAGAGIYEARQASQSREQLKTVRRQQDSQNDQIRQLQQERDDANAENAKLEKNIAALNSPRVEQPIQANVSPAEPRSLDVPTPDKTEAKRIRLSKDLWTDAGFATTEAALKTRGWAVLNGNRERFSESLSITPQARKLTEDMLIQMANASNDPDKKQILQAIVDNKLGVEDAILMPMMSLNKEKGFTSYNILSQQMLSPDESILEVETEMSSAPPQTETLKFQRFGNVWKIVIDEDFVKSKL